MNVRIFTLRYHATLGGFDDTEARAFLADKEVYAIHDHAFVYQGLPYLALVVTYHHREAELSVSIEKNPARKQEEDWRRSLTPETTPLFNTLREWRADKAKADGVPPYFICTNKQLAEIVRARPGSLANLARIEGIGKGKLERYGKEMLAVLTGKVDMEISRVADVEERSIPTAPNPATSATVSDEENPHG